MKTTAVSILPSLILFATLFVATPAAYAQIKYVAVVEVEIDARSGASADLSAAEAQEITAELRRTAVRNLPSGKYNIMTSETVQAQGGAVLEECAEENCVITLGSRIGADYIVRGIIRKFKTLLTLSVEIYETEDGNLVASSDPVRSENAAELLMKAGAACADMYKTFAASQRFASKTTAAPIGYAITAVAYPVNGGSVSRNPNQTYYAPGTIVSVTATPANGYAFTGWSGASNSTNLTLTAPVDRDLTLTANFRYIPKTYTLLTSVSPQNSGYVTRNPDKAAYTSGETVTLTAAPESGYKFTGWAGVPAGRKNRATVTMDGDKAVMANFYRKLELEPKPEPTAPTPKPDAGIAQESTAKTLTPLMLTARVSGVALLAGGITAGLLFNSSVASTHEKYLQFDIPGSDARNPDKVKEMRESMDSGMIWRDVMYVLAGVGLVGFAVTFFF